MPLALEIAERVRALCYEDLPPEAIYWAKVGILDTTGVTIKGGRDPSTRIVDKLLAKNSPGSSVLFGLDRRVGALDAARINGVASHALDFDDCNNTLGGHPSAPILPGLYALADESGASGRDFITAYVAGFETECKISLGVNLYQYLKGWHPTATIGIFGAAAACGHLLKLSASQIATALSIAASMAAGVKSNLGTMTKPLHVGQCAHNGLFAALLAKEGFTASDTAFEGKQGYFDCFNGEGNFDMAKILPQWGDPFDIIKPGVGIKQYPCCASTHPAIDCMLGLIKTHDLKPADVEKIESYTHPRRLAHTNRPQPKSSVDAKFSVQYAVSRALVERKILAEYYDGDTYLDPAVQAVMKKVHAAPYTTAQFPADNHFGAEVRVTVTGGKVLSMKVDQPLGRTSSAPLPPELLRAKFENCIKGIVHDANIEPLYACIQAFENLPDVRAVTALISERAVKPIAAAA